MISMSVYPLAMASMSQKAQFLGMFIVEVAHSFSIYYVLPVLWMTSCFHIMACRERREFGVIYCIDSNQILLDDKELSASKETVFTFCIV